MPESQIHFPTTQNVGDYTKMIEDMGGADVCYGGIGWSGHIAFFEPHLGREFVDDIDGYLQQGARIVDLHPITIMPELPVCRRRQRGRLVVGAAEGRHDRPARTWPTRSW